MENLPDYNLKELRRVVTDKGGIPNLQVAQPAQVQGAQPRNTRNDINNNNNSNNKIVGNIKTSKSSQKIEDIG